MKRLLAALVLLLAMGARTQAQVRVLVGPTGGYVFDNGYGGVAAQVELPFVNRYVEHWENGIEQASSRKLFELHGGYEYDPLEAHTSLGRGWSDRQNIGALWFPKSYIGFGADYKHSGYHVTKTYKSAQYVEPQLVFRLLALGSPMRLGLTYFRELHNGIAVNGDETSHLQGGRFYMDVRIACAKKFCMRLNTTLFEAGHLLTQGNPICDGTYSRTITCPRIGAYSGGASGSLYFEFPRRSGREQEIF